MMAEGNSAEMAQMKEEYEYERGCAVNNTEPDIPVVDPHVTDESERTRLSRQSR